MKESEEKNSKIDKRNKIQPDCDEREPDEIMLTQEEMKYENVVKRFLSEDTKIEHQNNKVDKNNIIVIGKHLCGGATDATLNYKVGRIAIALCCHAKSDGEGYINQKIFEQLKVSKQKLNLIHRATSWQFAFKGRNDLSELQE